MELMNFSTLTLEIGAVLLGLVLLALGLLLPSRKKGAVGIVASVGLALLLGLSFVSPGSAGPFFKGQYFNDGLAVVFKQIFLLGALLVTLMSQSFSKRFEHARSEYFVLLAFSLVGMMGIVGASDFLTFYIALELMSLPLVVLTAFERSSGRSTEAGVKYVLLGAMSSAVLLFGLSYLYGLTGSFAYADIAAAFAKDGSSPLALLGGVFVLAGIAFKVAAVPFHMWSPDIYEGAPAPITAFLAIGSKAAGFAALVRIFPTVLLPLGGGITTLLVLLAALSMVIGNLSALAQTNMKRLLAYSSIAHAGYMLLGIIAANGAGTNALVYYLILYLLANAGAFAAITAWSDISGSDEIASFKGMWKRSPFLASTFVVCLLSLAGIPPAAGFLGKFFLFAEIARQGMLWLVALALAMSVVSLYYYISVIKALVADPAEGETKKLALPLPIKLVISFCVVATVILGVLPGPIVDWISFATSSLPK
ncbi:MAG: NADH-quinone oxidoreductase subunit N [Spirochaetota bacterium]